MIGDLISWFVELVVGMVQLAGQVIDLCIEYRWFRYFTLVVVIVLVLAAWLF